MRLKRSRSEPARHLGELEVPGEPEVPARIRFPETTFRLLPRLHSQSQTKLSSRKFNGTRYATNSTASERHTGWRSAASRILRLSRAIPPIDTSCMRWLPHLRQSDCSGT